MPEYKLHYFYATWPARFLFHLADVPYEDVRYERSEWPKHKQEMPWGQLPVLEVDGKKLAQSIAIYQYLAKQFGYNGKDEWEAAQIQELLCSLDDMYVQLRPAYYVEDEEEKKKLKASLVAEHVVPFFGRLQKRLEANGTGYFVGNELTVADLAILVVFLTPMVAPGEVEKFPKLNEFVERLSAQPKIKEFIEKRFKTET